MSTLIIVLLALVLVVGLSWLVRGFAVAGRARSASDAVELTSERIALEEDKERALTTLKDLEFDRALKKISDEDYEELRAIYEQRAMEAIRRLELDDAANDAQSPGPGAGAGAVLLLLAKLLLTPDVAVAQGMPAGHPPIGGMDQAASPGGVRDVEVDVLRVEPSGATVTYPGATVVIRADKRRPGPSGDTDTLLERVMIADEQGIALFRGLAVPAGATLSTLVLHDGTWFDGQDISGSGARYIAVAYDTTTSLDALSMRVQVQWTVDEGVIRAQTEIEFLNRSPLAIDLTRREEPLFLPIPSPVVGGEVLTRGWLPEQAPGHTGSESSPRSARLLFQQGGVAWRGLILPGEISSVRLVMPLDLPDDLAELGFHAEAVPIEDLVVAVQTGAKIDLRVDTDAAIWGTQVDDGTQAVTILRAIDRIAVGDSVTFDLRHLPAEGGLRLRARRADPHVPAVGAGV
jgi:hypothetical protein